MLGWAAPACHKKDDTTSHPVACKYSLQYDKRPDERVGVRVWTWNVGSLSGKRGEVCEELRKRMNDVRCLQEVRWRGQDAMMLGMKEWRYKLWLSGKGDGVGGLRAMVKEELCEEVLEVRMVSDRVMTVVVFDEDMLRLICGYALWSGRSLEEKQSFYVELKCEWDVHFAGDFLIVFG